MQLPRLRNAVGLYRFFTRRSYTRRAQGHEARKTLRSTRSMFISYVFIFPKLIQKATLEQNGARIEARSEVETANLFASQIIALFRWLTCTSS